MSRMYEVIKACIVLRATEVRNVTFWLIVILVRPPDMMSHFLDSLLSTKRMSMATLGKPRR